MENKNESGTMKFEKPSSNKIEKGSYVISVTTIWPSLVKSGHKGQVVKVLETGYNVFFPLSDQFKYEDQIFFVTHSQIKLDKA